MTKTSILFVCLGNICRSPVAEAVFRQKVTDAGLAEYFHIDSAGTAEWHAGKAPDSRMIEAAATRGYNLSQLRARQVRPTDFDEFDHILAMDEENLMNLQDVAPDEHAAELALFLTYAANPGTREVPDPYFGGNAGFHHVIDLVENAADGLITRLKTGLPAASTAHPDQPIK